MNARIAEIEARNVFEKAEKLAVEEWIRSTGGTCGIVPVDFCAADSSYWGIVGLQKGNLSLKATNAAVLAIEIPEKRRT